MPDLRVIDGGMSDISRLHQQVWPKNRERGDFRKQRKAFAEMELRTVICAFCGASSPQLDGPTGRAWFASHECKEPAA